MMPTRIRINMIQQDTRQRHQGRAGCVVKHHRFETEGPAPIYRIATLLWLHGYLGTYFEVYDDRSPTGGPGGLAMTGRVRNWARLVNGKPAFVKDADPAPKFTSEERNLVAKAAGTVSDVASIDASADEQPPTEASDPPEPPPYPDRVVSVSTAVVCP